MENDTYLFVYGTLRSQMNDSLHRLLETYAIFVGTGSFQGKLYDIGRYPGAVRSGRNTDRVMGRSIGLASHGGLLKFWMNMKGTDSGANG